MTAPLNYLCIKTLTAPKTGLNAKGGISYAVLRDTEGADIYFCLIANEAGGYHSQEPVSLSAILRCLEAIDTSQPIPAKTFKSAFVGKSANNSGFLVAALRNESILVAAPDVSYQHMLGDNLDEWRKAVMNAPAEPFELPSRKKEKTVTKDITNAADEGTGKSRQSKKAHKSAAARLALPSLEIGGNQDDDPA